MADVDDSRSLLSPSSSSVSSSGERERCSSSSRIPLLRVRQRQRKSMRQFVDLCLIAVCYFGGGTLFYAKTNKEFTWRYSFFYATNVGLGVGYGNLHIRDVFTKWFTCGFMLVGSSLVVGALTLFAKSIVGDRIALSAIVYVGCIFWGVSIAFEYENANELVDGLLFAIGNYTTAGLITPHNNNGMIYTTLSLLVGCSTNLILMGQIAKILLGAYKPDVEEDDDFAPTERDRQQQQPTLVPPPGYTEYLEDQLLKAAMFSPGHLAEVRSSFCGSPDKARWGR